ncbi:MAG TPA: hypothetical protein IAA33_03290 [Candidatus Helicobacter avicola]|nr:hypothetical protein [Candidatus Helicobacter avicola]
MNPLNKNSNVETTNITVSQEGYTSPCMKKIVSLDSESTKKQSPKLSQPQNEVKPKTNETKELEVKNLNNTNNT